MSSHLDPVPWTFPSEPDFVIGTCNPSGISNKHHVFASLPVGWWHVSETQATRGQQCSFQGYLRSVGFQQHRRLRSNLGAPAPLRTGSSTSGSWTGVLCYGDCPLRNVPGIWPLQEFQSGRVLMTQAQIAGVDFTAATLYCPPRGPTWPNARALSDRLFQAVTEQLVCGRQGPRLILGDMNMAPDQAAAMRVWQAHGFVELQQYLHHAFGIEPTPTCKSSTYPDQIWLSREVLPMLTNGAVWPIFPDHSAVLAGLKIPDSPLYELQWPLPGRIPWTCLDSDVWQASDLGPSLALSPETVRSPILRLPEEVQDAERQKASDAFFAWSQHFEDCASQSMSILPARVDTSYRGRASLARPKPRRVHVRVPKSSRPGEHVQTSGFLNRSTALWFKQLRRFQSFAHAVRSARAPETFLDRATLWRSILSAPGFRFGFGAWWQTRPYKAQGSPEFLPTVAPDRSTFELIYEDYLVNYRRYEHWQCSKRKASVEHKVLSSQKTLFATTRKPHKEPLDVLEDVFSQSIHVVDTVACLISVPEPFPKDHVLRWSLQGFPAWVVADGPYYRVESDLVLVSGQTLSCVVAISDPAVIHDRLFALWSPRWNRHSEVPPDRWNDILEVARDLLPQDVFNLPPVSVSDWKQAVASFKPAAAAGPCGWNRSDLLHLKDAQISQVLDFFSSIEQGGAWPVQMNTGLVHLLQKKDTSAAVDGFRPITICSMLYRAYASIRAGQMLHQLSKVATHFQCGFMPQKQATDLWFFVNVCVELSLSNAQTLHGCVADLVKAYNTLPRTPVFACLRIMGAPDWMISLWARFLDGFSRYFLVQQRTSEPLLSCTGYPEGCPLSCVAMSVLDLLWHLFQMSRVPRCLALSFVDNLELVSCSLADLRSGFSTMESFCTSLDLQIDRRQLYAWATSPEGRNSLRTDGFQVSFGDRDLGGQVQYTGQHRNAVLTDRIASVHPYFQRLRWAKLPPGVKMSNIARVLWPRALHGSAAVELADSHLQKLRSGAMKAMGWNRAGSSPLIRVGLLHTSDLDPGWYHFWLVVQTFRQQCNSNRLLKDWWQQFSQGISVRKTHGPFAKIRNLFHSLGLHLDENGKIWFSEHGCVSIFSDPEPVLRRVLLEEFQQGVARQVGERQGFQDLDGFDSHVTCLEDASLLPADRELLNIVRDGTFHTDVMRSKFDVRKSSQCPACQVPATLAHKYAECSLYDSVREHHPALLSEWDDLPDSAKLHGLAPDNPWRHLLYEAFLALPSRRTDFECRPQPGVRHVFTDGSCSSPTTPVVSLAAWAVIDAVNARVVSSGPVPGIHQTICRAEIYAVWSALEWGAHCPGETHIWSDSQLAVDQVRRLQQNLISPGELEHADLWVPIADLLNEAVAEIYIHKVVSHLDDEDCGSPLDDWCRFWNGAADTQAALENHQRPSWFRRVWTAFLAHRSTWCALMRKLQAFHLDVAHFDCQPLLEDSEDDVGEGFTDFDRFSNDGSIASILPDLLSESFGLGAGHVSSVYPRLFQQIGQWLISVDLSASESRVVGWIELYVGFCLSRQQRTPLLLTDTHCCDFNQVTFAADYQFFRKFLFAFLALMQRAQIDAHINLGHVGIFVPQPGIKIGWTRDVEAQVNTSLCTFIGNRPVTSTQALSKPWRL